jgi:polysaccharide export outer membrane protein
MRIKKIFLIVLSFCLLAGCATNKKIKSPKSIPNTNNNALLEKAIQTMDANSSSSFEEDKICSFDLIEINVYREKSLTKVVRVPRNGKISFPFIGTFQIKDLTILQAEHKIETLLKKHYFKNPKVSINIKDYYTNTVSVSGEVKSPGVYKIPRNKKLTVIEAILLARGFTELAAVDKTRIIRMEDGQKEIVYVKIKDILEGNTNENVSLEPDDIIFVPQRIF